jgi:outer membrane protein assembly factor BamB
MKQTLTSRFRTPVLSLLAALGLAAPAAAGPAVTYQINPTHTGATSLPGLSLPLAKRWTVDLGQTVSYPIIAGGRVFVTVADNTSSVKRLVALDLQTGAKLWEQPMSGYYWRINAAYDGGRVFTVNTDGVMSAYDAASGALQWSRQLPGQYMFSSAPSPMSGVIYTGGAGSGGTVYAVAGSNGSVLWTRSVANGDESSPAVDPDALYVSYAGPQVYRFQPATGNLMWHYNSGISGGGGKTPVYYNGRVYVRSGSNGQIFDAANGSLIGSFPYGPAPAFDSGRMYFVSGSTLTARDAATQTTLWTQSIANPAYIANFTAAPIVVNGSVVAGTSDGMLYVFDGASGALQWSGSVGAAVSYPDEHNVSEVLTGLGAGEDMILVPAGKLLVAFGNAPGPDTTPPTTTAQFSGSSGQFGWYRTPVQVTLKASDGAGSGVAATYYRLDGATLQYTGPFTVNGEGTHSLSWWSVDVAGNQETAKSATIRQDFTPPTLTWGTQSPLPNAAGWNNSPVSIPFTKSDNLSGIVSPANQTSVGFRIDGANQTAKVTLIDGAGNTATFTSPVVNLDMTVPATTVSRSGSQGPNGAYTTAVTVTLTGSDALSGVSATSYRVDGGATQPYAGPFTISGDGAHTVTFWSTDVASNVEAAKSTSFTVDTTPPITTASVSGPAGTNGWYTGAVQVTLSASDASGATSYYRLDGAAAQASSGPVTVSGDAVHSVEYWSVDGAGNGETHRTLEVKIDGTAPTLAWGAPTPAANAGGWNNGPVDLPYTTADNLSGVASAAPGSPVRISGEGRGLTATVTVTDAAGNTASFTSPAVNIDRTAPSVTASASPASLPNSGPKTRSVTISGRATDALSGIAPGGATYIVTDEYGAIQPSGGITLQADGSYSFTISLEARKAKADQNGRVYTVRVTAVDRAGNPGSAIATVTVQ